MRQKRMERSEEKIAELLKNAKRLQKKAEKAKFERYFEGQKDVLKQMLAEMAEPDDEATQNAKKPQALSLKEKITASIKKAKKQKKKVKKVKDVQYFKGQQDVLTLLLSELKEPQEKSDRDAEDREPPSDEKSSGASPANSEAEALLNDALSKEIVIRKSSYYLHDSFPSGKAHGKHKVLEFLGQKDIAAAIQKQLAEAKN